VPSKPKVWSERDEANKRDRKRLLHLETPEGLAEAAALFSPEAKESTRMLVQGEVSPLPPLGWLHYLARRLHRSPQDHNLMMKAWRVAGGDLNALARAALDGRTDERLRPLFEFYAANSQSSTLTGQENLTRRDNENGAVNAYVDSLKKV